MKRLLIIIFSLSISICSAQTEATPFQKLKYRHIKGTWFVTKTDSVLILKRDTDPNQKKWIFNKENVTKNKSTQAYKIKNGKRRDYTFISIGKEQYRVDQNEENQLLLTPFDDLSEEILYKKIQGLIKKDNNQGLVVVNGIPLSKNHEKLRNIRQVEVLDFTIFDPRKSKITYCGNPNNVYVIIVPKKVSIRLFGKKS